MYTKLILLAAIVCVAQTKLRSENADGSVTLDVISE